MTTSEIVTECGAIEFLSSPLRRPLGKILGINMKSTHPYFLGLVGGYTTSTSSAISLYKSGRISKTDCERIISCSSLPSLAFLTSFVGAGIFQNPTMGWVLWALCIISSIITAFIDQIINKLIMKKKNSTVNFASDIFPSVCHNDTVSKKPFSKILVGAISHSAQAMLIICA